MVLPVHGAQHADLFVRRQAPRALVDVGELVARGVDLEVVRVADEGEALLTHVRRGRDPGGHERALGVVVLGRLAVPTDVRREPLVVVREAVALHDGGDVLGVLVDRELIEVVRGVLRHHHAVRRGQVLQQRRVGLAPAEAEGQVVDDLEGRRLARDPEVAVAAVEGLEQDLFEEPGDVGGAVRMAVAPAQAFAERERVRRPVFGDLPARGDVRHHFGAVGAPAHQVLVPELTELREAAAVVQVEQFAAVVADAIGAGDHHGVHGEALGDGGQVARSDALCEHRGFAVRGEGLRRGGHGQREAERQGEQAEQLVHQWWVSLVRWLGVDRRWCGGGCADHAPERG